MELSIETFQKIIVAHVEIDWIGVGELEGFFLLDEYTFLALLD